MRTEPSTPSQNYDAPMHTYLEKRDPRRNVARYYRIAVQPNLFGEWTLHREWGRIGQGGRIWTEWFRSEQEAEDALLSIEGAKRRRGYYVEPQQLKLFDDEIYA